LRRLVACVTVSWVSFLEAPERVVTRPARVRRRTRIRVTVAAVAVAVAVAHAVAAGVTYYAGWWGSYEHRLTASVRHLDCKHISTDHHGWAGEDMLVLNERASRRFAAFCEELGPMVTWLRFPSAAAMRAALAATPTDKTSSYAYATVCVSQSRAEVLTFYDVGKGRIDGLCAARDGRIVHRQRQ
jgi:hypothetical protein